MSSQGEEFSKKIAELRVAIAAVDIAFFSIINNALHIFLIPIDRPPHYVNLHGLPGGIIEADEDAESAASRHLKNKVHVGGIHIEQLYTFSDPARDKRSRSISIAYMALVPAESLSSESATGSMISSGEQKNTHGQWYPVADMPGLAYDHAEIIDVAVERLKGKLAYTNIVANLLSKQFTFPELQNAYEIILNRKLDKRNFRKKMLSLELIKPLGKKRKTNHRPAELYQFVKRAQVIIPEIHTALNV